MVAGFGEEIGDEFSVFEDCCADCYGRGGGAV